jgi:hypothetical protein
MPPIPVPPAIKWGITDIPQLSDTNLLAAKSKLAIMLAGYTDAQNDPRYEEKFKGQPPRVINPQFTIVQDAINAEVIKRGL